MSGAPLATARDDYDAFGNLLHSTATGIPPGGTTVSATPNEFLFAGEQFDSDLNLYYNRARYLNVSTGRFWTMDSAEGKDDNPASLHKYLYAGGDSVNRSDPSGRDFTLVGTLAAAIVLTILVAIPTAHDTVGPGAPTYQIILEQVVKDPIHGFHKQFEVMIHTQGDANQFIVVQWIKGSLTRVRDGHFGFGILDSHQGVAGYPYNFPDWEIDSVSEMAVYPGEAGSDVTSLTRNGAWIKFYDNPGTDPGAHSYVAALDFRINVYQRWKVSNYVSGFQSVDNPKLLLSIPWGFHDSYAGQ